MKIERAIRLMAGCMIVISLSLAHFNGQVDLTSVSWIWLTVFVGLNLIQSSFTGFCLPEIVMKKMGMKNITN